jgi:hypothetical protein
MSILGRQSGGVAVLVVLRSLKDSGERTPKRKDFKASEPLSCFGYDGFSSLD